MRQTQKNKKDQNQNSSPFFHAGPPIKKELFVLIWLLEKNAPYRVPDGFVIPAPACR
jgi:hypothetical protein